MLCQDCQRPLTLCAPRFCPVCSSPSNIQAFDADVTGELLEWAQPRVEAGQMVQVVQAWPDVYG